MLIVFLGIYPKPFLDRINPAVNRLVDAAYNKSILPVRVREAARMRIAQLNDCTVCLAFRADTVKAQGLTEGFYCHVGVHDDGAAFSTQERLAMDYADWKALHDGYDAQRTVMYRKILLEDGNLLQFFKAIYFFVECLAIIGAVPAAYPALVAT